MLNTGLQKKVALLGDHFGRVGGQFGRRELYRSEVLPKTNYETNDENCIGIASD